MSCADPVAVVIPAYNAEDSIAEVVRTMPDFVRDIIVVEDGSRDRTANRLDQLEDPRLKIIHHSQNRGVGAAISTGYRAALQAEARIVAVMGADCQMDPSELKKLVQPVADGEADYSKGNRFACGVVGKMPTIRIIGNIALSLLSKPATGYMDIFDSQCGYTAIDSQVLRRIDLDALYPRYGMPNDLLARLHRIGARVVDVPVTAIYPASHSQMQLSRVVPTMTLLLMRLTLRRAAARMASGRSRLAVVDVRR